MAERTGNIWHVEDDSSWRGIVSRILTGEGHDVLSTPTFRKAFAMVPEGVRDRNILIVDMDLGPEPLARGDVMVQLVRVKRVPMISIGLSSVKVPGVDLSLDKARFERSQLINAVGQALEMYAKLPHL